MRESTWLKCDKVTPLLGHLNWQGPSARKLRLFACACCRPFRDRFAYPTSLTAIEVAERYADGQATREQLAAAGKAAIPDFRSARYRRQPGLFHLADAARACALLRAEDAALMASQSARNARQKHTEQVVFLRDIFGNPFRPVVFFDSWRTPTALALARAAYEERDLSSGQLDADRLAILADALEEADCYNADLLTHLRDSGPHVRGCWALDLVLAKEEEA